jgi:hypothetical protein
MRSLFLLSLTLGGALPVFFYVITNSNNFYEITKCHKVISSSYISYHSAWLLIVYLSFSLFYKKVPRYVVPKYNENILFKASLVTFILSLIGYFFLFYLSKDLISNIGSIDYISLKKQLDLTGTGTPLILKHLHTAFSILFGYQVIFRPISSKKNRTQLIIMYSLGLVLDIIRSFGLGERIALVEYILPPVIFYLGKQRLSFQIKALTAFLILSYAFFTVSESTRSWTTLRDNTMSANIWQFGFDRMTSYYTTSINNSSLASLNDYSGYTRGYYIARCIYNTPIIGKIINVEEILGLNIRDEWSNIITSIPELNEEFNLFSAPGFCFLDIGYYGLFVALVWGSLCGMIISRSEYGFIFPTLLAPIMITSCLEISRTLYFCHEGRIPVYVAFIVLYLILKKGTMIKKNV